MAIDRPFDQAAQRIGGMASSSQAIAWGHFLSAADSRLGLRVGSDHSPICSRLTAICSKMTSIHSSSAKRVSFSSRDSAASCPERSKSPR